MALSQGVMKLLTSIRHLRHGIVTLTICRATARTMNDDGIATATCTSQVPTRESSGEGVGNVPQSENAHPSGETRKTCNLYRLGKEETNAAYRGRRMKVYPTRTHPGTNLTNTLLDMAPWWPFHVLPWI